MVDEPQASQAETSASSDLNAKQISSVVFVVAVTVGLVLFAVQNSDSIPVRWLMFDTSAPLFVVIVISAVAGAVLSELVGWMMRRRRRR